MSKKPNIVWLFADQHRADVLGAAGHPVVTTPHLDRIAANGTLFEDAYCQAPLCVPARVSLLTERYVRDHGAFDNDCEPRPDLPTMVRAIRDAGYDTTAIGKMHLFPTFQDLSEGESRMHDLGFTEVYEEIGKLSSGLVKTEYTDHLAEHDLLDTYRAFMQERSPLIRMARADDGDDVGKPTWAVDPIPLPPEHYLDTYIGRRAAQWIESRPDDDPFFLWVGFPGPHDPWDAPEQYVDPYRGIEIPLDSTRRPEASGGGPLDTLLDTFLDYSSSDTLTDDRIREVRRHYFANVSVIDEAVGGILAALERRGIDEETWIIYTADHGEMLGTHGLLNKMLFYDPAVRVPLIVRPPGGSAGRRVSGMVEHVDLSATLRAIAGADDLPDSAGRSFLHVLGGDDWAGRTCVVSENHGFGMWRTDRFKLTVYERDLLPVQLFDLDTDPAEDHNVVDDPAYRTTVQTLMDEYVRPFLATAPVRPGPDLVERSGQMGLGIRDMPATAPAGASESNTGGH